MINVSGIIFDKDGTLFDFQSTWAQWARSFLLDLASGDAGRAQVLGAAIGFDFEDASFEPDSPVIAGTPEDIALCLLQHMAGATTAALVTRMNAAAALAPMQEAVPLQDLLRLLSNQGIRLGVATNDAEGPARAHLRSVGIEQYFDFIAGCDSGFGAKPAPGQLLAFAEQTGLAPQSLLMVGDSRQDMAAGRAAGMATVGVLTGLATERELAPLADRIMPDIGHLPGYLLRAAA